MTTIPIRELRNNGGSVAERVLSGEEITVTRAGKPIMELKPLPQHHLSRDALLTRWQHLPQLDPARLRAELDTVLDSSV